MTRQKTYELKRNVEKDQREREAIRRSLELRRFAEWAKRIKMANQRLGIE
jgi:hypothetical protein